MSACRTRNDVVAVDISEERVALVNDRKSPIIDAELERFLVERELNLTATTDAAVALCGADYVIVATSTHNPASSSRSSRSASSTMSAPG